jgi:hypothetical protein
MAHLDVQATELIKEVKAALGRATPQIRASGLKVTSVKLDLEATLEIDAGGKISLFKILTLEAKRSRTETQTISVTLKPPTAERDLQPTIGDTLEQAITVIAAAAKEAADQPPELKLDQAEVSLQVAVTNDGSVEVFVEGEAKQGNTHTLTISLETA